MFNWDDNPDLNITPLIDVILVLNGYIHGNTFQLYKYQEQIELPDGSKKLEANENDYILIEIDKKLNIHFDPP